MLERPTSASSVTSASFISSRRLPARCRSSSATSSRKVAFQQPRIGSIMLYGMATIIRVVAHDLDARGP
jgi:hypothetical protein